MAHIESGFARLHARTAITPPLENGRNGPLTVVGCQLPISRPLSRRARRLQRPLRGSRCLSPPGGRSGTITGLNRPLAKWTNRMRLARARFWAANVPRFMAKVSPAKPSFFGVSFCEVRHARRCCPRRHRRWSGALAREESPPSRVRALGCRLCPQGRNGGSGQVPQCTFAPLTPDRFTRLVILAFRGIDHPEVRFALLARGASSPFKRYLITQLIEHLDSGPRPRRNVFDGVQVALQHL